MDSKNLEKIKLLTVTKHFCYNCQCPNADLIKTLKIVNNFLKIKINFRKWQYQNVLFFKQFSLNLNIKNHIILNKIICFRFIRKIHNKKNDINLQFNRVECKFGLNLQNQSWKANICSWKQVFIKVILKSVHNKIAEILADI